MATFCEPPSRARVLIPARYFFCPRIIRRIPAWEEELQHPAVCGVVFIMSVADFSKKGEFSASSRLVEALDLLNTCLEQTPAMRDLPLVVMLNKADLFEERLEHNKFRHFVQVYPKDLSNSPYEVNDWLQHAITKTNVFLTTRHGTISCFLTQATDVSQARNMITSVFNAILMEAMEGGMGLEM